MSMINVRCAVDVALAEW